MIRSRNFWAGALSLAIIPVLLIDVAHHYVDWTKDVHNEIINLAYHQEVFNTAEKTSILDNIFDQNQSLGIQLILKSVIAFILLLSTVYCLRRYFKEQKVNFLKPSLTLVALIVMFLSVKVFVMPRMMVDPDVHIVDFDPNKETFQNFYKRNFKGKTLYVDFWGVYCGPCLEEFKYFTPGLKKRYAANKNIEFLYVCGGDEMRHEYMWREQIQKYNLKGNHLFLNSKKNVRLYNMLTGENRTSIYVPRYMIVDANGKVAFEDAARPSDKSKLYTQLESNVVVTNK